MPAFVLDSFQYWVVQTQTLRFDAMKLWFFLWNCDSDLLEGVYSVCACVCFKRLKEDDQRAPLWILPSSTDTWIKHTCGALTWNKSHCVFQQFALSLIHSLCFTERSSLSSSSSSSSSHPLSHSVDQLRKGKVLVWNLRITCRLRKQRERIHRVLAGKVRWWSEGQLIAVSLCTGPQFLCIEGYKNWNSWSKLKALQLEWLNDVWSVDVWNFCSWNGTFRGNVIIVLTEVGYRSVMFYLLVSWNGICLKQECLLISFENLLVWCWL